VELNDPAIKNQIMPALRALSATLCRCVVPIFRDIEGIPVHRGCGFLVFDDANRYIVSAAHVLREARLGPLFISLGGKRIRHLTGKLLLTPGPGVPEADDELDVGVIVFSGDDLPPYPEVEKDSISLSALCGGLRGNDQSMYLIVGFPSSKGGRKAAPLEFGYQPYSYANAAAPISMYTQVGVAPSTHLLLTFNQRQAIGPDGIVQAFPYPYGMSGSPVWLLSENPAQAQVVGIATSWKKSHKVVVATDVAAVLTMIQQLMARERAA
jgi:hypothetical protein